MIEIIIIVAGVVLDQLTKMWAASTLVSGGSITIIEGVVDFRYVENTGAAFGILKNATLILAILSAILAVIFVYVLIKYRKREGKVFSIGVSCIIAGAIGNMIDRIFIGYVVDFIEFTFVNFAIFNVADTLTTIGIVLFAVAILFLSKPKEIKPKEAFEVEQSDA